MTELLAVADRLDREAHGQKAYPINSVEFWRDIRTLAAWVQEQVRTDDDKSVTAAWLRSIGFADSGLRGMTILLPPQSDEAAIVELCLDPNDHGCMATLIQGVTDDQNEPDDLVLLTSFPRYPTHGQVRRLLASLGMEVKR